MFGPFLSRTMSGWSIADVVSRLVRVAAIACALLAAGCASSPSHHGHVPAFLFADQHFGAPSEPIAVDQMFVVSESMRDYLRNEFRPGLIDQQTALAEALYRRGHLKLEYESAVTRNAAEAFDARAGNCLSLVIMTAAFAKELGLRVRFQSAYLEENWTLKDGLLLGSRHVNITLGRRLADVITTPFAHELTIDFLPSEQIAGLKTREIPESLVVSMFMNNRAIEAMVGGRNDDAYAWARGSVVNSPDFVPAQNTLGLLYLRKGLLSEASAVFEHMLADDASLTFALANLSEVRTRQGRVSEAERLRQQLARLESRPPLQYYQLGLAAMKREDFRLARDYFASEVKRPDTPAIVRFWLGVALYRLGDVEQGAAEVARAAELSGSRRDQDLYAAKLDWLRSLVK